MDAEIPGRFTRRQVVGGGLLLGAAYLTGCAGTPRASAEAIPGPVTPPAIPNPIVPTARVPTAPANSSYQLLPRAAWTRSGVARPANTQPMRGITRITIHHDGMNAFTSTSQIDAATRIEAIRASHLGRLSRRGEPWADIGYHFAVDPGGRVWEARPTNIQGAHVEDQNEENLGIVMLGNYDRQGPTRAQTVALDGFVADQMKRLRVPISRVYTHQEIGRTACPGTTLQRYMVTARGIAGSMRLASV